MSEGEEARPADPPPRPSSPGWRRPATLAVAGLALAAAAGIAALTVQLLQPTALEAAVASCELDDDPFVTVGDEGRTITIDGANDEGLDGALFSDTYCVLDALDVSTAATAQMEGTNSLQGRQTASWNDVTASWTYHPDEGFDIILTQD